MLVAHLPTPPTCDRAIEYSALPNLLRQRHSTRFSLNICSRANNKARMATSTTITCICVCVCAGGASAFPIHGTQTDTTDTKHAQIKACPHPRATTQSYTCNAPCTQCETQCVRVAYPSLQAHFDPASIFEFLTVHFAATQPSIGVAPFHEILPEYLGVVHMVPKPIPQIQHKATGMLKPPTRRHSNITASGSATAPLLPNMHAYKRAQINNANTDTSLRSTTL